MSASPNVPDLLDCIRAMPQVIQAATIYRPRVGRRSRGFLSVSDMQAYEDGYMQWPVHPIPMAGTPASTGWMDAEGEQLDRLSNLAPLCDD